LSGNVRRACLTTRLINKRRLTSKDTSITGAFKAVKICIQYRSMTIWNLHLILQSLSKTTIMEAFMVN
jgi:hypothetical protein